MTLRPVAAAAAAATIVLSTGASVVAQARIRTPLQVISLWSREILDHITGERQQACSGANADKCERIGAGYCDGRAEVAFRDGVVERLGPNNAAARQTETGTPQYFSVQIANALQRNATNELYGTDPGTLELEFDCQISGNDLCPGRFQIGRVDRVSVEALNGDGKIDLKNATRVHPEGKIIIALDPAARDLVSTGNRAVYQIRVAAECFTVKPRPVDWTFPLHEGPSATTRTLGSLIVRVTTGVRTELVYQPLAGPSVTFEPDWSEPDTGYTYLMEQTMLDRQGEWVQLPRRPFAGPVWVRVPSVATLDSYGQPGISRVRAGEKYVLGKAVEGRRPGARSVMAFPADVVVIALSVKDGGRTIEIRREESFDNGCGDDYDPSRAIGRPTYLVDAEQLYDADRHLQLRPAYTRGC